MSASYNNSRFSAGGNINTSHAQNLTVADAEFNNVTHGHRTNLIVNLNQSSPAESPSRTGITSDYTSMPSSHRNTRSLGTNTLRVERSRAPQTVTVSEGSNVTYQRHLERKRRGFPLWIPPPNQNLPIQYRRTGVSIGDVGIITPTGGFSFLFNICLPRDDPVNLRSLPEHFSPVSPGPFIDKFPEFGHGSHLASSIEMTQANPQSLGFQFESSAPEGAILIMPLGATSERLQNIPSFRRYAASNMVHWYKLVNVDLECQAKNGDIRLVIGCVKTKSWGIATFAKQSRQSTCRLRFSPSSNPSSPDSSGYFWEYSGTDGADGRAGPSPGENDGLRLVDDSGEVVYENQCLFLETLNPTLSDNVWSEIHHDPGSGDLSLQGDSRPAKDSASKATSTSRTSATKSRSSTLFFNRFMSRRNLELQNDTVPSDKLAMLDTDPLSGSTSHPSNIMNRILMEMVPTARMVITQDDDWSSVACLDQHDTTSDPHELLEQILVSRRICEEDGVIFLDRREGVSSAQIPASESHGASALDTNTLPQPSLNLISTSISTVIPSISDRKPLSIEVSGINIKSPTTIAFIELSIGSTFQRVFDFAAENFTEVTLTFTPARLTLPFSTTLILEVHQEGFLYTSKLELEIKYHDLLSNASTVDADTDRREYRRTVNGIEVDIRFIVPEETLLAKNQLSTADKISQVNTGDHEKLPNAVVAEREVTIGDHVETPIHEPEREPKKAATPLQPIRTSQEEEEEEKRKQQQVANSNTSENRQLSRYIPDSSPSDLQTKSFHSTILPNLQVSVDCALTTFEPGISPWMHPSEWLNANMEHIRAIFDGIVECTENKTIAFPAIMIFQRLIVYLFAYNMLCPGNETLLGELNAILKKYQDWDILNQIRLQGNIKNQLLIIFRSASPEHHEMQFEDQLKKLLILDSIALAANVEALITDEDTYEELVETTGLGAQSFVDLLDARLEFPMDPRHKHLLVRALTRLSEASGFYPESLTLNNVTPEHGRRATGGSADVYKGKCFGEDIAIKVFKTTFLSDRNSLNSWRSFDDKYQNLLREFITWRQLSHPNVLPFYGVHFLKDTLETRFCLVSPWMENGNIVEFLARRQHMDPTTNCVCLALDIAQGIQYLHSEKIIHRDVKGRNILISSSMRGCITDFGLATLTDSGSATTLAGNAVMGTPKWLAPELFPHGEVKRNHTYASDIYAFALVCYELFSGRLPFEDVSLNDLQLLLERWERPSLPKDDLSRRRGLSPEMEDIIRDCWAQEQTERPSADEVVERLQFLQPVDTRPPNEIGSSFFTRHLRDQVDNPLAILYSQSHRLGLQTPMIREAEKIGSQQTIFRAMKRLMG